MESNLLGRYLPRIDFDSYKDFKENFNINIPENFNFGFDIVDEYARLDPEKVALVWCDDNDDEETFTFEDLKRYSNKAANFLRALGIGKGDSVMLMLKRRYEYWYMIVALHKLGAVAIPGTHMLTARDLEYRSNAAGIKMIITADDEHLMDAVDESQAESPTLKHKVVIRGARDDWHDLDLAMQKASDVFERPTGPEATTNDDTMLLYFTSGTTGMPKMVRHDNTYPLGHILTAKYWQNVQDNGLHLTVADTGWAKTAWGKIYGQWIAGSAVFVYDYNNKFDAKKMLTVLERYSVTTFCAPATVYRMLVREDLTEYDLKHLKHLCVAGEPLYPEVFASVQEAMGLSIHEGFGQTETAVALANFPWMEVKPGSMGKPSPSYDVELLDEDGLPCADGEEGEIIFHTEIRKPFGMFCEYYNNPKITRSAWSNGIYRTGDIAWRDKDGYYWYVGRADDAIKSSGYKIGPFEVESALQEHPAVHECAVTGTPDPVRGQVVKATIVLSEGYTASDELVKELQDHVKKITAPYKYPRVIAFTESLPKTISGKISRRTIKHADLEKVMMG
ncbi:MAG: AMP-binding protein [Armatimonadota bacterium]|nr:AMP-binding protein [bacterium]